MGVHTVYVVTYMYNHATGCILSAVFVCSVCLLATELEIEEIENNFASC